MNRVIAAECALGMALGIAIGATVLAVAARWLWHRWEWTA